MAENGETLDRDDTHVPSIVIQFFLDLCQISQKTKGRKSTHDIIYKPIIPETVGVRGQADLVDLQLFEYNGYNHPQLPGLLQQVHDPAVTKDQDSG